MATDNAPSKPRKESSASNPEVERSRAAESNKRQALIALVGEQVLLALGKPKELQKVQVRSLWESYYRVNILVGGDVTSVRVAHSYFITADASGKVVESNPKIKKQY